MKLLRTMLNSRMTGIVLNGIAVAGNLLTTYLRWPDPLAALFAFCAGGCAYAFIMLIGRERDMAKFRAELEAHKRRASEELEQSAHTAIARAMQRAATEHGFVATEIPPPLETRH